MILGPDFVDDRLKFSTGSKDRTHALVADAIAIADTSSNLSIIVAECDIVLHIQKAICTQFALQDVYMSLYRS